MSSGSGLPPYEHAAFAVSSRLISCLVTEQILPAVFIPFDDSSQAAGIMVVSSDPTFSVTRKGFEVLHSDDIFALVPLYHPPVLQDLSPRGNAQSVGLVDPLDMVPSIFGFRDDVGNHVANLLTGYIIDCLLTPPWELTRVGRLYPIADPVDLWKRLTRCITVPDNLRDVIELEIRSSRDWQALAYQWPPSCPTLHSPPIAWEQSLVAGHPTHPMHRARSLASGDLNYDWYHPKIYFVRVPKTSVDLLGNFEELAFQFASTAALNAGQILPRHERYIYMPIHELQVENVTAKFHDVQVLSPDISFSAQAQSSVRTVIVPEFPGLALKLSVGVKISSSLRTISHFTANLGPRFSTQVVPKLAIDPEILAVELETSTAVYRSGDPDISKHLVAIIREEYEAPEGEALIVCAALLEMDHVGIPPRTSMVQHIFSLDTEINRAEFLDRYIRLGCEALLPALVRNGVAFEAHAQNMLARFDIQTGSLRGFVFRDLGGLRIHPPTLRDSTGVDFTFLSGHCVATETLEEIYPKFYHTFVHNHIQRLIRLLGLHYNGRGWEMLRRHMGSVIPQRHPLWKLWLDPESQIVQSKCLMRMRMKDSYRDVSMRITPQWSKFDAPAKMVYGPYPNVIQYRSNHPVTPAHPECEMAWRKILAPYVSRITTVLRVVRDYFSI